MQEVLAQAPILKVKLGGPAKKEKDTVTPTPKYSVTRHEAAKGEKGRYRLQTSEEQWWQEQADLAPPFPSSSSAPTKRRSGK